MRNTATLIAAGVLAAGLAACQPASVPSAQTQGPGQPAGTNHFGNIPFEPCSLTSLDGGKSTEANCGTLQVAEDPAKPEGRTIDLNIAWLAPANAGGTEDPVFFLAGGPGQAATQHAASVTRMLGAVGKQRAIILVDQRGTGQSNPLDCRGADGAPLPLDVMSEPSEEEAIAYTRQCVQGLEGRADPRFYTTSDAVRDLDAVRAALGVEKINLVGVSYGTRVAQQYAATYPQHTRSVVLDGVAPNELVVGGEFATTLEEALRLQSAQCRQIDACAERYPTDMREQLRTVMQTLRAAPVEVDYRDSRTNLPRRDTITADAVGSLAFLFSYLPQTASLLPLTIDEATRGRYAPLMSLVQMSAEQMQGQMSRGMQWSVVCSEDASRYVADPDAAATIMGAELSEAFFAPCAQWSHGEAPEGFHKPFTSEVPVLLLSGELDPVTPPRYGEQVVANLPNGRHLVLKGQGHNVSAIGCMPKLLGQFVETADAKGLDASCLDNLSYVPPFVNFNGWSP
ncbi:alpha/beta hydrolase [Novilysobacter antarcticus]|uniref:alpha/beta hydrolase n=1 Tax=Novilysobacter antarcticus TaxID=2862543 RepID=UPI001C99F396|nr:alpha/beta hydrolase [Lysobacter antarcticus]